MTSATGYGQNSQDTARLSDPHRAPASGTSGDALRAVFAALRFPAPVWLLVAQAHSCGVDAEFADKLTYLPVKDHRGPDEVLRAFERLAHDWPAIELRRAAEQAAAALAGLAAAPPNRSTPHISDPSDPEERPTPSHRTPFDRYDRTIRAAAVSRTAKGVRDQGRSVQDRG